jgi:predicted permease
MKLLAIVRSAFAGIFARSTFERDMDDELRFHIERVVDSLVQAGIPPAEARRRAVLEFGGLEARKDECREARGLQLADELSGDVRYALRQLRRSPAFTAVAVVSLALGIGANTAILGLIEAALWKPIPVREPDRLRQFSWVSGPRPVMNSSWGNWSRTVAGGRASTSFSYPAYEQLARTQSTFDQLFGFKPIGRVTTIVDGQAELASAILVSGRFYEGIGTAPRAGRAIVPDDDVRGGTETVALISDAFWARRFARDPSAIGRRVVVNQVPVTIIGVNPAGFSGPDPAEHPDVFMPLAKQPLVFPFRRARTGSLLDDPDYWWVLVMGRLKAGVTDVQAREESDRLFAAIVRDSLPDRGDRDQPRLRLLPGARGQDNLREAFGRPLLVLVGLVGLVLLMACANVATLLLVRASVRQREVSLRLALGAGRWRIARQLLTEGLVLGLGAGALGVALGYWVRDVVPSLLVPSWVPDLQLSSEFDLRVLLLATAVSVATSVLFSLAPIWQAIRIDINSALKAGGRMVASRASARRGRPLVVVQVCLSVVLLVGAGLFVRTLWNLRAVDVGFQTQHVVLFTIDPPRARYAGGARKALFTRLHEGVAAIPGVEDASLSESPLVAGGSSRTRVGPDGRPPGPNDEAWVNDVGARFFETLGIPIVSGRSFDAHDTATSAAVVVVSERFVREFFPDGNPIGRAVRNNGVLFRIVGVCGDVRFSNARLPSPPLFYRHFAQTPGEPGALTFEVRTPLDPATIVSSVRQAVRGIDRDLPVFDVRTQDEQIDATMARERLFVTLTLAFGAIALALAAIGIYGTVAHGVVRRTGEIGIRLALGAERRDVLLMILREASFTTAIGAAIGVAAAAMLTRYVQAMLFGVTRLDPATLAGAVTIIMAAALLAGWLPARRAARLDPMTALRHE